MPFKPAPGPQFFFPLQREGKEQPCAGLKTACCLFPLRGSGTCPLRLHPGDKLSFLCKGRKIMHGHSIKSCTLVLPTQRKWCAAFNPAPMVLCYLGLWAVVERHSSPGSFPMKGSNLAQSSTSFLCLHLPFHLLGKLWQQVQQVEGVEHPGLPQ